MRRLLTLLACLTALAVPARADTQARDSAIVARAVDGYIRPATARFAGDTGHLEDTVAAFCAAPGSEARDAADAAFHAAVVGWSGIQFLRLGPLMERNRLERVAFWPDPKGIGLRQIRKVLADRDPGATDPAQLAGKSVALQGLTALEYLLYGTDGAPAGAPGVEGAYRCDYATAAATSLNRLANAVAREWAAPDGFARRLTEPAADDPLYRAPAEALTALHGALGTGLQVTQDQKLKPVLGEDPDSAKPRIAPFRRSGLTMAVLAADLRGLKSFFTEAGFAGSLPEDSGWLEGSIGFEFDNAVAAAEAVALPIDDAVYDREARSRLEYLFIVLGNLRSMMQQDLAAALGLTVGFNSLDGD